MSGALTSFARGLALGKQCAYEDSESVKAAIEAVNEWAVHCADLRGEMAIILNCAASDIEHRASIVSSAMHSMRTIAGARRSYKSTMMDLTRIADVLRNHAARIIDDELAESNSLMEEAD